MEEWNAIDLHMHTSVGITGGAVNDEIKNFTYSNFINALKKCDIKLAAITNHNIVNFEQFLLCKYLARKNNINIIFGVELDTETEKLENYHVVVVFDEEANRCFELSESINKKTSEKKNAGIVRYSPDEVIGFIENYNAIIIPHGTKNKGIFGNDGRPTAESLKKCLQRIREGYVRVFDNGFSELKFANLKEHLKKGKLFESIDEFGGVLFSDNRDWANYDKCFCGFYMNAEPTYKGFLHSITNPQERFSLKENIPTKRNYITQISIRALNNKARISDCDITLKSGYNCIIGKSGSGKSLLLHLIKKYLKNNESLASYSFSDNNKVVFKNEVGIELSNLNINVEYGKEIFHRIVKASDSKNDEDMYSVVHLLDSNFSAKSNFYAFREKYRDLLKSYCTLCKNIEESAASLKANLTSFETNAKKINDLSKTEMFTISIPEFKESTYNKGDLNNIYNSIEKIDSLKLTIKLFKEDIKSQAEKLIDSLKRIYISQYSDLFNSYIKDKKVQQKIEIVQKCLTEVNKNISQNASEKNQLNSGMPVLVKNITKSFCKLYLDKKRRDKYDLSINTSLIKNETFLDGDKKIRITENINEENIKVMHTKVNDIFYTRGIQQNIVDKTIDMSISSDAREVIDEYYRLGKMTVDCIDKVLDNPPFNVDVYFNGQNVKALNPGNIAKEYITHYFNHDLANGKNSVVLFDQIENDVDKTFINETIVKLINDAKMKTQVIIVTHDPIVAVNADPINYIEATKNDKGIISYRNFVPESYERDELETIANNVDGSKQVIRERYQIYKGENDYGN